jgi:hypothetical protein
VRDVAARLTRLALAVGLCPEHMTSLLCPGCDLYEEPELTDAEGDEFLALCAKIGVGQDLGPDHTPCPQCGTGRRCPRCDERDHLVDLAPLDEAETKRFWELWARFHLRE